MSSEKPKLLPQGQIKKCVVPLKSCMGAAAAVEIFEKLFIYGIEPEENDHKANLITGIFESLFSALNFSFSYVSGCQCYSPMDPNGKDEELNYTKSLAVLSKITDTYTVLWWIKSTMSMFKGIMVFFAGINKKDIDHYYSKAMNLFDIILCGAAGVLEVAGDAVASGITVDNSSFADETTDKEIYLLDTSSYFLNDAKGFLDALNELCLNKLNKTWVWAVYFAFRSLAGIGEEICLSMVAIKVDIQK